MLMTQLNPLDVAIGRKRLAALDAAVTAGDRARIAQELGDLQFHSPEVPGAVLRLWPVAPNTGDAVERVRQLNRAVVEVVVAHAIQAGQVNTSRAYSMEGAARLRLALAEQALKLVRAQEAKLPELEGLAVSLAETIARQVSTRPSDPAQALRDATIVRSLAELDPASRSAAIEQAVRDEELETLRAVVQAPKALRLLSEADLTRFAADLLRLIAPRLWAESEGLREALGFTKQTIDAAIGYLEGAATGARRALRLEPNS